MIQDLLNVGSIVLPNIRITAKIFCTYNKLDDPYQADWETIETDEYVSPSIGAARAWVMKNVPAHWHDRAMLIYFRPDQQLMKMKLGAAATDKDGKMTMPIKQYTIKMGLVLLMEGQEAVCQPTRHFRYDMEDLYIVEQKE